MKSDCTKVPGVDKNQQNVICFLYVDFPLTLWAIQPKPSLRPSLVRAEPAWMWQSWFFVLWWERENQLGSLQDPACLQIPNELYFGDPHLGAIWKVQSFMMEILALSVLSITAITMRGPSIICSPWCSNSFLPTKIPHLFKWTSSELTSCIKKKVRIDQIHSIRDSFCPNLYHNTYYTYHHSLNQIIKDETHYPFHHISWSCSEPT